LPVLDGITRGKEARGYIWLCITKGMQARDLLSVKQQGIEKVLANSLESMQENQQFNFDVIVIQLNDYYKKSLKTGIDPIIGVLEMNEKTTNLEREGSDTTSQQVKLSGGAVIKEDRLVGYLNEIEARGYNWVIGSVKSGILTIPSSLDKEKLVSVEIRDASSKITPEIQGDHISFNIEIDTTGVLVEQQGAGSLKTRKEQLEYLNLLEKEVEKLIEREVNTVIEKAQNKYEADIFGFGVTLYKKDPKKWKEINDKWMKGMFQNAAVTLKVKINIQARELLKEPLKSRN
jgi:spore germination protein KC